MHSSSDLKVVQVLQSLCGAGTDCDDAMVPEQHDSRFIVFLKAVGKLVSFLVSVNQAAKVAVVDNRIIIARRVLMNHLELVVFGKAGQRRRVVLVRVEDGFSF